MALRVCSQKQKVINVLSKPPYTITEKAADYLAKIVEAVTRLEFGTDFARDIKLHRENRVRTIHSSLAIEGNTLSLDEVAAVLDGKLVAGKQAEIKEVKNAYEAYDKIMTFDPYSVKDFLKAHELMTQGLLKEAGKFRSGDVGERVGTSSCAEKRNTALRNRNHSSFRGRQRAHGQVVANASARQVERAFCVAADGIGHISKQAAIL